MLASLGGKLSPSSDSSSSRSAVRWCVALTRPQEWCGRRAFDDGVLVWEKKLLLFLDEVVLSRRFVRPQRLSATKAAVRRCEQGRYRQAAKRQLDGQEKKESKRRKVAEAAEAAAAAAGGETKAVLPPLPEVGEEEGLRSKDEEGHLVIAVGALRTDIM